MNVLFSEILDSFYFITYWSSALLSVHDFCSPQCSSIKILSMGAEWVYFFRLISLWLSEEKGGQILLSCEGWNLCSPFWTDTSSSHHTGQNSLREPRKVSL